MLKKIVLTFFVFLIFQFASFANGVSSSINDILSSFDFDRDSVVSISVKDKNTGLIVYEKNAHKFLNPASTLKLFTMASAIDTLGEDYNFDMAFYKDKHNNLYLKLSGDPIFSESDMGVLVQNLKKKYKGKINKIYIDDFITDKIPYPDGWTIDDFWPSAPKLSPYIVDKNTVKVDFLVDENKNIRIVQKDDYKFSFVNKLKIGDENSIKLIKDEVHNTVDVTGEISSPVIGYQVPVLNPKYFFCNKLKKVMDKNSLVRHEKFLFAKTPNDAVLVAKFSRPLCDVIKHILTTSDNFSSEVVFKVAGGKYAKEITTVKDEYASFGTTENGINMFYNYYDKLGLDTSKVKLKDGSGVSRYNVINTDWMTEALLKMNFDYEKYLPTADEGTLSKRMRELKDKVYLKTGTLYGVSSLAGIIKTEDKEYCYSSVIMSYNRNKSLIKGIEDEIVYEIYRTGEGE